MKPQINVILTDDKERWRRVIRKELEAYNINVIEEAGNGIELLTLLESITPDVILLDLEMPGMDGNETMEILRTRHPHLKIIIVSQWDDDTVMADYSLRGARACFSKKDVGGRLDDLARVIKSVHKGKNYFNFEDKPKELTPRQKEIIKLYADGLSTEKVAKKLKVTRGAVSSQKNKILAIFGIKTLHELYKEIYKRGMHFFKPLQ